MAAPTIVLLLKAPHPGKVKTRLAAEIGEREAVSIYRLLVERQVRALPDWPAEVHVAPLDAVEEMRLWLRPFLTGRRHPVTFRPQAMGDLGARLAAAMTGAFSRGAAGVLFLGGDCPGATAPVLENAGAALARHDAVVGPALDGGYWTLGLRAPRSSLFEGIAWSTERVLEQTLEKAAGLKLSLARLETLEDVDDAASWRRNAAAFGLNLPGAGE